MARCQCCHEEFTEEEQRFHRGTDDCCSLGCLIWVRQRHTQIRRQHTAEKSSYIGNHGYRLIYVGTDASPRSYALEQRVVMERALGRKLDHSEHVHHIDGNRLNNDLSNLQLITNGEHQKLHNHPVTQSRKVLVACAFPGCDKTKFVKRSRLKTYTNQYCGHAHRLEAIHQKAREYHARRRAANVASRLPVFESGASVSNVHD
jgi:HNH endonuclease